MQQLFESLFDNFYTVTVSGVNVGVFIFVSRLFKMLISHLQQVYGNLVLTLLFNLSLFLPLPVLPLSFFFLVVKVSWEETWKNR